MSGIGFTQSQILKQWEGIFFFFFNIQIYSQNLPHLQCPLLMLKWHQTHGHTHALHLCGATSKMCKEISV